jgi:hypothetical protein
MNANLQQNPARGLASLRRLTSSTDPALESCELCAATIPGEHQHLVDPRNRRLLCACTACAILFDGSGVTRYQRVPRDVRELTGIEISDAFWNRLSIPIGLVFFFRSSAAEGMKALYPSPAGPTESSVDEDVWRELAAFHSSLETIRADVEALLVNRTREAREYYIVPVDECYKLTGVIRQHWQGFSGGDEVWQRIRVFFDELKRRSRAEGTDPRA